MTPKTTRESIISLEGHITGLKRDMHSLKTNDLVHIHADLVLIKTKVEIIEDEIQNFKALKGKKNRKKKKKQSD
jgi:hypothetical protein